MLWIESDESTIFVAIFFKKWCVGGIFLMIIQENLSKGGGRKTSFFVFLHKIIGIFIRSVIKIKTWVDIFFVIFGSERGDFAFDEIFGLEHEAANDRC